MACLAGGAAPLVTLAHNRDGWPPGLVAKTDSELTVTFILPRHLLLAWQLPFLQAPSSPGLPFLAPAPAPKWRVRL